MPISPTKIALKFQRQQLEWFPVKLYKREIREIEMGLKQIEYRVRGKQRRKVDKLRLDDLTDRLFDFDPALEIIYIPTLMPAGNLASRTTEVEAEHNIEPRPQKERPLQYNDASTKWCARCGEYVARENFHKDASRRDGLANWCKPCKNAHQRGAYWRQKATKRTRPALPMAA